VQEVNQAVAQAGQTGKTTEKGSAISVVLPRCEPHGQAGPPGKLRGTRIFG
jgi:hypothetical protein